MLFFWLWTFLPNLDFWAYGRGLFYEFGNGLVLYLWRGYFTNLVMGLFCIYEIMYQTCNSNVLIEVGHGAMSTLLYTHISGHGNIFVRSNVAWNAFYGQYIKLRTFLKMSNLFRNADFFHSFPSCVALFFCFTRHTHTHTHTHKIIERLLKTNETKNVFRDMRFSARN